MEIYLTERLEPKVRDNYHTVLMARNMDGLREINRLIGLSTDADHYYYNNRITFDEFLSLSDNVITTSACLASPLNRLEETHPRYEELVKKYDFLEVQPHAHPEQVDFNKKLLRLSKAYGKPLIAGTDTHSSSPYKAECRRVLMGYKGITYGDEDAFDLTYKTYDELVRAFGEQGALPEEEYMTAIENTNLLLDMTEDLDLDLSIKYPILYGSREEDEKQFRSLLRKKFTDKVQTGVIPPGQVQAFKDAIVEELRVFEKLGMTGFMLSMSELVSWCKESGMPIGFARGSVGGSRIAYVTDIIDLNPEQWQTVFSRFCNESRLEVGDVDIDVVEKDRPAIFKHITSRFGADKTARVASFGTIQDKGTIDVIGGYLAKQWKQEHPSSVTQNPWSLDKIDSIKKQFDTDRELAAKTYPQLFKYFEGLSEVKISQSIHPAGIVISPVTLGDNYGVFHKDGELCMLLDMDNIHDYTGLVKYDFLILKTIQIISETCAFIGKRYPKTHEIDWDDPKVWDNMASSPEMIFQMNGDYAHNCLRKFRPRSIYDLSLVTAAIRPSGESYRDELLARKPRKNPSEIIDELLKKNIGYLVYQEDTIAFLQQCCGLSGSEADTVRRGIGRKKKEILDEAMPRILDGYCKKSPKPPDEAKQEAKEFLQIIEDSASYQFG